MTRTRQHSSELVLVASERHAEHETAQGVNALTLREFATCVLQASAPEQREATLEGTRLLTRRTLRGQPTDLALAVDDALGQLRRAGTGAAELARVSGSRGALLAEALRRTSARLAELGLRDQRENSSLGAKALGSLPVVELRELLSVSTVRVRGIAHFEHADLALLEALHRRLSSKPGGGVVIELPTAQSYLGSALRDAVAQLASRLEQRWSSAVDHPELEFTDARADATPPTVIEAAHEASEARAVARAVLEALARGAALDRMAIVPVDGADAFLEPLRAELSAARVPFSEAWTRPTSSAPEAHAALELLRLAQGPLLRDSLVDVLRVPDLRLEGLLGEAPRTNFIDVLARLPVRVDRTGRELLAALETRRRRTPTQHQRDQEAL
ncbi:MAG: hypothetical protein ABIQ16_01175, partial [Polyangiaceae bacterium]